MQIDSWIRIMCESSDNVARIDIIMSRSSSFILY